MSKRKKKGGGFWLIVLAVVGCLAILYGSRTTDTEPPATKELTRVQVLPDVKAESLRHVYYQLDTEAQELYRLLEQEVAKGGLTAEARITPEDFDKAYHAFLYDHPEFFWLSGGYSYSYDRITGQLQAILKTYEYWSYTSTPERYIREFNSAFNTALKQAKNQPDDYHKLKAIHDYLAQNAVYDHDVLPEINKTQRSTAAEHALSAYGTLVNGKTLCGGYSESLYLLANALGVDCTYMQGDAGEPHAWNYLKLDGKYYYMDVTWDDIDFNGGDQPNCPEGVSYAYYCITSEELQRTHTPETLFSVPKTAATEYNYHHREGYFLNTYNFDAVQKACMAQKDLQVISVKFPSGTELNKAVEDLMKANQWQKIPCLKNRNSIRYNADTTQYILNIYLEET